MARTTRFVLVLVTAPDLKTARRIARVILQARAAACVNLVPRLESHYWWLEKIESSREVLLLIKSTRAKLADLEQFVFANHPYDTPEFVILSLAGGNARYLKWLANSVS